jgi:hypothetical protein
MCRQARFHTASAAPEPSRSHKVANGPPKQPCGWPGEAGPSTADRRARDRPSTKRASHLLRAGGGVGW